MTKRRERVTRDEIELEGSATCGAGIQVPNASRVDLKRDNFGSLEVEASRGKKPRCGWKEKGVEGGES